MARQITDEEKKQDAARTADSEGLLHYKYMQRTGVWTGADNAYAVLGPKSFEGMKVHNISAANATMKFNPTTWEDMPTQYHIINALASLPVHEIFAARITEITGNDDLFRQRIVR